MAGGGGFNSCPFVSDYTSVFLSLSPVHGGDSLVQLSNVSGCRWFVRSPKDLICKELCRTDGRMDGLPINQRTCIWKARRVRDHLVWSMDGQLAYLILQ